MSRQLRHINTIALLLLAVVAGACRRHVPAPLPPPAPPSAAAAPSVTLTVEPGSIQQGQSATLRWNSQNATELNIDPDVGRVDPTGSQVVSPSDSTTYTLTGSGPGGSTQATARLTVTAGAPAVTYSPPSSISESSIQQRFQTGVADAFFDYDKADIRADARTNLTRDAAFLRDNPNVSIQIEGHCDVRGSTAYNLGLGDRRANAARDFLVSLGINAQRISTISYGKERPFCTENTEDCYQQNRRAHLVCTNCGR